MTSQEQEGRYLRYGQVLERIACLEQQLQQHFNLARLEEIEIALAGTAENQLDQIRQLAKRGSDLMKMRKILEDEVIRLNGEADRLAQMTAAGGNR